MERKKFEDRNEVYSQRLKAGKRTYFFDVKSTRNGDYFITVTESKKVPKTDGEGFFFEKHKIFLQKEDFMPFLENLQQSIDHVKSLMPDYDFNRQPDRYGQEGGNSPSEGIADNDTELRWE